MRGSAFALVQKSVGLLNRALLWKNVSSQLTSFLLCQWWRICANCYVSARLELSLNLKELHRDLVCILSTYPWVHDQGSSDPLEPWGVISLIVSFLVGSTKIRAFDKLRLSCLKASRAACYKKETLCTKMPKDTDQPRWNRLLPTHSKSYTHPPQPKSQSHCFEHSWPLCFTYLSLSATVELCSFIQLG